MAVCICIFRILGKQCVDSICDKICLICLFDKYSKTKYASTRACRILKMVKEANTQLASNEWPYSLCAVNLTSDYSCKILFVISPLI